jgi:4-hydroxybenzoate polyprenyltransferase
MSSSQTKMMIQTSPSLGIAQPPKFAVPALLRLMRPANVVTAHADILAGCAAASTAEPLKLTFLLLATTGLYGGGIVLNDVFDAQLDSLERPERPIPSRAVTLRSAMILGGVLLSCGVAAAFLCSTLSGLVAVAITLSAVLYDSWGKHQNVLGPINMGLCRGLNLLLGMTVAGTLPANRAPFALVTLCYIAGVTALSRGEVRGGTRTAASISLGWLSASAFVLGFLAIQEKDRLLTGCLLLSILAMKLVRPFWEAFQSLDTQKIRWAIRTGVLSLILLDSVLAALCGGWRFGLAVVFLYIPATLLAKLFAVT